MKPARIIVICIAAISAIALAFVVRAMGSSNAPTASAEAQVEVQAMAKVMVAARDLAPGARLTEEDLTWKEWPADQVNPLYITDGTVEVPKAPVPEDKPVEAAADAAAGVAGRVVAAVNHSPGAIADFVGSVVREPIIAGEPILPRKIVRAGDSGYLAAYLEPGMRAMAIPVTVESAAGGFILPGDRVDVVLTREVRNTGANANNNGPRFTTATVMQNIKVLAIDQTTHAEPEAQTVVGATATLQLSPNDAEALTLARSEGELSLMLRSYADTRGPSGRTGAAIAARAANAQTEGVKVYRPGQTGPNVEGVQ